MSGHDWLLVLIAVLLLVDGIGIGYLLWHRAPEPEVLVDADEQVWGPVLPAPRADSWSTHGSSLGYTNTPTVVPTTIRATSV